MTTDTLIEAFATSRDSLSFERNRILSAVCALWRRGEGRLEDAVIELEVRFEIFLNEVGNDVRSGNLFFTDQYEILTAWLRHTKYPWDRLPDSALDGLSQQELYLVLAKAQIDAAWELLSAETLARGWTISNAIGHAIVALISSERALAHAEKTVLVRQPRSSSPHAS
jgi:hypothetical protein